MKYVLPYLLGLMILTGCALNPSSKQVAAVGKASSGVVSVLSEPHALSANLRQEASSLNQACRYLEKKKGVGYTLAAAAYPQREPVIDEQLKFAKALSAYTKALASVTGPNGVKKLNEAADGLADAVNNVAVKAIVPPAVAVGPVVKFGLFVWTTATEYNRRYRIRQVIERVDRVLRFQGLELVNRTLPDIETAVKKDYDRWEEKARCNLDEMRHNKAVAFVVFRELDAKAHQYNDRRAIVSQAITAYQAFRVAHHDLLDPSADFDAHVAELQRIVDQFVALNAALANT